ncbi:hypothetical protein [Novosphingobium sp. AAP83]|uniref:hypothetical protein n=1 Tax=Novosphingobium sp. AAP83 TaxID=1523425 RepID=UPI0018D134C2|nr:hypothetical protein [Novosphingobium sp. AAP83]
MKQRRPEPAHNSDSRRFAQRTRPDISAGRMQAKPAPFGFMGIGLALHDTPSTIFKERSWHAALGKSGLGSQTQKR